MKPIQHLLLIICLLVSQVLLAQKNSPVAGDAAQLVDLLKKDYNSIDPSTRNDELIKDRSFVIATFKAYMTEDQKVNLAGNATYKGIKVTSKMQKDYEDAQQKLKTFSTLNINVAASSAFDANAYAAKISELANDVEQKRKLMFGEKYRVDNEELICLKENYSSVNNYAEYIINQFIQKYTTIKEDGVDALAKSNPNASLQKGIPFIGGDMGFEVVIEGLSKFLAKRIKEELTTQVIEKVKNWLENPKEDDPIAELKVLLPRTNAYLIAFKASQVTSFPNEIKQYIEDDLNHIIENLSKLRNTPRIQRLISNHPDVDFAFEALELIPNLSKIKDPIDYFETIENSRNLNRWSKSYDDQVKLNIANTLKLSSMLAHSLTIIENGQPRFAGSDFISAYGSDLNFYLLYVGFLYQQNNKYYEIEFKITDKEIYKLRDGIATLVTADFIDDTEEIKKLKDHRDFFETMLVQLGKNAEKVYTSALEIKKANKKGDKIGADTIYTFVKSIIELAEEVSFSGDTLVNYIYSNTPKFNYQPLRLQKKTESYFKVANATNEIVFDLQNKKYATAIIKTLEITNELLPNKVIQSISVIPQKDKFKNTQDWKVTLGLLSTSTLNTTLSISPGQANSAKVIFNELNRIKLFYQKQYGVKDTLGKAIDELIEYTALINYPSVSFKEEEKLKRVLDLLALDSFKYLVISYYSNCLIDEFANKLENELIQTYVVINDKKVNLFRPEEAKAIKAEFLAYVDAAFTFLTDNNEATFMAANVKFNNIATDFILRTPEKFNLQIDENILKLIHFLNDMALSQNSDDIAKAIEAFALPAGSYSIKRDAIFNVSLNSYPGVLPAWEVTWKNKTAYGSFSPAFTAPVGLSFTWGNSKGISKGIFVPIIDIGAVTRMHLGDDIDTDTSSASTLPEFNFLNIFSPGLYYCLGLKKTPLSLNIGAQYGPGLREIMNNGDLKNYESVRIGIGVVLDIPLLNLHTKPRFN